MKKYLQIALLKQKITRDVFNAKLRIFLENFKKESQPRLKLRYSFGKIFT